MNREKREADLKIYVRPSIEEKIRQLAEKERRPVSAYCSHILEQHVALKIFQQEIGGAGRTN
jgi:hypothetical protein